MARGEAMEIEAIGGGEITIAAMDENSYMEIGRKTYRFVRRLMRDPETRAKIQARAAEIRAAQTASQMITR